MQIGIISDIHDNITTLKQALVQLQDTDALICCGDLCSPFIIKHLGEGYSKKIHIVFGNNDGDLYRITQNAQPFDHIQLHGEMAELAFDGCRFGVNHYDTIGRVFADSNRYDVVCYGHNHQFELSQVGDTSIINPGEICGALTGTSSFVIYDTQARSAEKHTI